MMIAIIDMGTNTFHLLLAEVKGGTHHVLYRERKAVKIGEKGINQGEITPEAWARAIEALKQFKKVIDKNEIDKVFATATSAIRNASNGKDLVLDIEAKTGIVTEIISGEREAELILKGVQKALPLGEEKSLVMDIGGGSIEFIIANEHETFWLQSFEIGGQRLVEKFHKSDPISQQELNALITYFDEQLVPLYNACAKYLPQILIGCSGTFDTLSDIYRSQSNLVVDELDTEYPLTTEAFASIYGELVRKNRTERLAIPGMIEMRVEMIVVASVLVNHLISRLNLNDIRVSAYALKEGVLVNTIDNIQGELLYK